MKNHPSPLKALYWVAMTFSFATTGYALSTVLPDQLAPYARYAMAFGGSLFIQTIIGIAWPQMALHFRQGFLVTASVLLMLALGGSLASGLLASSTNTLLIRGGIIDQMWQAETRNVALDPVRDTVVRAEKIESLLAAYAAFAAREAEIEEATGTSCDGQNTSNICGPLCRLRAHQSRDASERAANAGGLLTRADVLRASAGGVSDQAGINELFARANALSRAPLFRDTAGWVARERAAFSGGGFRWEGTVRQCNDAEAVRRLDEIADLLESQAAVALTPPTIVKPGIGEVASENAAAMRSTLARVIEGEGVLKVLSSAPASLFIPFWGFSLLIELLCITLGIRLRLGQQVILSTDGDRQPPTPGQRNRAEAIREVFDNLVIRNGRHTYLLVPKGGNGNRLCRNAHVISRLPGLRVKPFPVSSSIPVDELSPDDAERIKRATGADNVEVFKLRNARRFEQRLASAIGIDDRAPPNLTVLKAAG